MLKMTVVAVLIFLAAGPASAQTATFTFGGLPNPFGPNQSHCASITSWNGVADAEGGICLDIYPDVYTSINIPSSLGFPNNGYLTECSTVWQPLVNNGDGTATQAFTASSCYDGGNTTITATVNYQIVHQTFCGRTGCHTFSRWQVVGGNGTVVNQ